MYNEFYKVFKNFGNEKSRTAHSFFDLFGKRTWLINAAVPVVFSNLKDKGVVYNAAIAGSITGVLETIIAYPADFIKTTMQLDRAGKERRYSGGVDIVQKTVQRRGFVGLYRGLAIVLVGNAAKKGLRFGTYEFISKIFRGEDGSLAPIYRFFCGYCAGKADVMVITPLLTVKTRLIKDNESRNRKYRGGVHCLRETIKETGVRSLYQSYRILSTSQSLMQAIRFSLIGYMEDVYTNYDRTQRVPKCIIGTFGAIAAFVSVMVSNPLDVIQTQIQGNRRLHLGSYRYAFFRTLWIEGPNAFYRGAGMRVMRACIEVALTFMLYQSLMEYLDEISGKEKEEQYVLR